MTEIVDLDVLVPGTKQVKFGGQLYTIPSDMPMAIFLRINLVAQLKDEDGDEDQIGQIEMLADVITDLFVWELPDGDKTLIKESVLKELQKRSVKFVLSMFRTVYAEPPSDDDAADPTQDQAPEAADSNGTTSSSTSPSPTTTTQAELPVASSG